MSYILRSSQFVRYFAGLARGVIISNRQDIDKSLLQKSQHLASAFSCNFSLTSTNFSVISPLDSVIRQLDEGARKTGRISMKEIEDALNEIRHLRTVSTSQSLMVIRCCGNLVPEEPPEQRTQLVEEIWKTFEKLGVSFDISHYNALLKVYLENEHKFSATEFLARLEKQGVEPNRVTYQRLIAGYCQLGDIAGATKILEFMKEKQLPVSEGVFNALILGHSQADDMESAEGMLAVMRQANIEPSNETYCTLLCGYAGRGDSASVERLITDCKVNDVLLSDKDFLEVAYRAAVNGHDELVDKVLQNIRNMVGYNQDAANVLLRLITKHKDDAAYKVFQTMSPTVRAEGAPNMSGHIIIKQLVKSNRSAKHILSFCEKLEKEGHTNYGLSIALETSFTHGNVDLTLDLLRELRDKQEPVRNHYFWPSMMTLVNAGQSDRLIGILDKMVNEFNFSPNFETLVDYYLPYVGDKSPRETFKRLLEIGVSRRQIVLAVLSRLIAQNRLTDALNFAQQHPGLNLKSRNLSRVLVESLEDTSDVKTVVKILHIMTCNQSQSQEEEEDGESGAMDDVPNRFLIGVAFVPTTRVKLLPVLQEMASVGLGISSSCAEAVESRLSGSQLTTEISELLARLSAGDLIPAPHDTSAVRRIPPVRNASLLEKAKERIKSSSNNVADVIPVVRGLFNAYCEQGDIENALKAKQEWVEELKQELTPGWWTVLMEAYCSQDNLEGAKECWQKIKELDTELEVDSAKVLKLAKLYIQNKHIDDALTLLKETKIRREGTFAARTSCWQVLQAAADTTKDPELVKKLLNILVDCRHTEVNNVLLGPIIKAYLLRDDVEGALLEFEQCVKKYRATPFKNDLTMKLIQNEDATKLQTLVDLSTQVHGEINSLYDLVFSFVECGRIRQARKILETPGLNTRPGRLHHACERYSKEGLVAPLEGLVEATKDLPHIDRSEIYYNLLEIHCKSDDIDKALGLWTQMQDEDVTVSDEFLVKLGNFLKMKGHDVPFVIPYQHVATKESAKEKEPKKSDKLLSAIRAMDVNEALKISSDLKNNGTQLSRTEAARLLELLVEKNRLDDALNFLTSLQKDRLPNVRAINFFLNKLCQVGDLERLTAVGVLLSEDLKKITSYSNKYITCAVAAGRAKEELEKLERAVDAATTPEDIDALAQTFPRGGIFGVLEASPSYHDQVAVIADKYFKKGFSAPANCLCMYYLASGETEKAKQVYQQYNLANSSQIMFKNVLRTARKESNPKLIEELVSLLENAVSITPESRGLLYSNLINEYCKVGNFEIALSKLEEALKTTPIEHIYNRTLLNLKDGLESRNIPFKYTIPDKIPKESSSSSSSSSEADTKKSAAAKQ